MPDAGSGIEHFRKMNIKVVQALTGRKERFVVLCLVTGHGFNFSRAANG
jgi:hypothetical protein